jgi:hypothetical protein
VLFNVCFVECHKCSFYLMFVLFGELAPLHLRVLAYSRFRSCVFIGLFAC